MVSVAIFKGAAVWVEGVDHEGGDHCSESLVELLIEGLCGVCYLQGIGSVQVETGFALNGKIGEEKIGVVKGPVAIDSVWVYLSIRRISVRSVGGPPCPSIHHEQGEGRTNDGSFWLGHPGVQHIIG